MARRTERLRPQGAALPEPRLNHEWRGTAWALAWALCFGELLDLGRECLPLAHNNCFTGISDFNEKVIGMTYWDAANPAPR